MMLELGMLLVKMVLTAAVVVMGDSALKMAANDYQRVLPAFIMGHMNLFLH